MGLILCYTAFITPFTVHLLVGYLTTIPKSLDEAAVVDGANRLQVVGYVILPIIWPGLVAVGTYGFLQRWSEYLLALTLITESDFKTISLGLNQYFGGRSGGLGGSDGRIGRCDGLEPSPFLPLQKKTCRWLDTRGHETTRKIVMVCRQGQARPLGSFY